MKIINNLISGLYLMAGMMILGSCEDFLDRQPLDQVTPEAYLNSEADLAAYSINAYSFSFHGGWGIGTLANDVNTDNMCGTSASYSLWVPGQYFVPNKSGSYSFNSIRNCNYFLENVLPKFDAGKIVGSPTMIKHYIGEMFFLRAWNYFIMLKKYGDFPIIKTTLTDEKGILVEASKRSPRNIVARFILQDLDLAISYMQPQMKNKNRLSRVVAQLVKSRVALYEASWETYHKNTPFVPGGPNWPGATKDYNKNFKIDIDAEINFFLDQAMESSKAVADATPLEANSHVVTPEMGKSFGWNPYYEMFVLENMTSVPEILFWRAYDKKLEITHAVSVYLRSGGAGTGLTRSYVDGFLMKSGLPIYADSNYKGDKTLTDVKEGRDERLQLFIFSETDPVHFSDNSLMVTPAILAQTEMKDVTGYRIRKCFSYDPNQAASSGMNCTYGSIVFRAAEAYLNYIEASYMKKQSLDPKAIDYWKAVRTRAGINPDFNLTISATDLSKENDWGKYSAGKLVDATLFNIRRERRNEFIGEGMRMDDLKRWRALDQVVDYIPEGFNLWDVAYDRKEYKDEKTGASRFIEPGIEGKTANVSAKSDSKYLRPYRIIKTNNQVYNGYKWSKANYLDPLPAYEIQLTAGKGADGSIDLNQSPIYQNPYWPLEANKPANDSAQ